MTSRRTSLHITWACLLVAVAFCGCLTVEEKNPDKRREAARDPRVRTETEDRPVVGTTPDEVRGPALVFGRFYFYLDGYADKKGDLRKGIEVCVTEYWPEGKRREHWTTTDETGYFQLENMDCTHGYNLTEVVFPGSEERAEVQMGPRFRADYRVVSLGQVIGWVRADGKTRYIWQNANLYDPTLPPVKRALERNAGTRWEKLIRARYVHSLKDQEF